MAPQAVWEDSPAQLARRAGARVLGIASAGHADLLGAIDVEQVAYGDGLGDRLRSLVPNGIDAFVDAHGGGHVDLAVALRVALHRIDTIIDFDGAQRHGAKTDASPQASDADILATMAEHVAWGRLTMPIAAIYPLEQVRAAYTELGACGTQASWGLWHTGPGRRGQGPTHPRRGRAIPARKRHVTRKSDL